MKGVTWGRGGGVTGGDVNMEGGGCKRRVEGGGNGAGRRVRGRGIERSKGGRRKVVRLKALTL